MNWKKANVTDAQNIPELIVPFEITLDEAKDLLADWCHKNSLKKEARAIREKTDELQGFYLPYELVRGPVTGKVYREDGAITYDCGGFVDNVFVNCSKQLDNLLLDGMEPFDLEDLHEFDFGYIAGRKVKTPDITGEELTRRIDVDVAHNYEPVVQKTLETKAVGVNVVSPDVLHMPVLLPVYYLNFGDYMCAVNGQTGKVSIRAVKESHYIILPWWIKAIFATVISVAAICGGLFLFGAEHDLIMTTLWLSALLLSIIFFCAYSQYRDDVDNFIVDAGRKIFTSKGGPFVRENTVLVQTKKHWKNQSPSHCFSII